MNTLARDHSTLVRTTNGPTYHNLNKNGKLDIYEDPDQPIGARVANLLAQMDVEEKAGALFINLPSGFAWHCTFAAKSAAIMPYYDIPVDQTDENVAMSFNKRIITGLLREKYQFDGVVCTDWGLITDTPRAASQVSIGAI